MPVQRETTCAIWSGVTTSCAMAPPLLFVLLDLLQLGLEVGDDAVSELAGAWRDRRCRCACSSSLRARVELLLQLLRRRELFFSSFQRCGSALACSSRLASSFSSLASRSFEAVSFSFFSASRSILSCMMRRSSSSSSSGLESTCMRKPRRRLVDQVDRLVGQEAVGDVAVGERGCGDERGIGDAHAVMHFVFLLQPAQDGDGVLDRRLRHEDRLEAPRERRVLLHMLAVFVERGGADAMQLAAGKRRLEQVRRVHRAFRLACADQRVHLVDEEDDLALRRLDLVEHGLQPLLELAAIFRAGDQRAHVERKQPLVLQALRHVALDDAVREPLDDGRLADARLADQHGIVLGAARQHLDGAADLLVAADHRIELALGRGFGEVARVALQRVISLLGAGAICGAALAQVVDGGVEVLRRHARIREDARGVGLLAHAERLEQALDRDEAVAGLGRHLLGLVENPRERGRHMRLGGAAP